MRFPNLDAGVTFPNGAVYTVRDLLSQWAWGHPHWATNEATDASFKRIKAALKLPVFSLDAQEFEQVCTILRNYNWGQAAPQAAIELSEVRNLFIFAPTEAPTKVEEPKAEVVTP